MDSVGIKFFYLTFYEKVDIIRARMVIVMQEALKIQPLSETELKEAEDKLYDELMKTKDQPSRSFDEVFKEVREKYANF